MIQNASKPGICSRIARRPLDRPQVAAARAGLGEAQDLGDLGRAELLEVLQGQDLAVDRVHAVERLLDEQAGLGLDGRLRRRGQRAQQLGRQRDRVGQGQAAAVQGDLAVGVAELRAQVAAVDLGQLERRQVPQPEEQRQLRLLGVLGQLAGGLDEGLLEHVRVIDPARQPAAEPEVDHPLEAVAVRLEEGAQRLVIASGRPPEVFPVLAIDLNTRVAHTL